MCEKQFFRVLEELIGLIDTSGISTHRTYRLIEHIGHIDSSDLLIALNRLIIKQTDC